MDLPAGLERVKYIRVFKPFEVFRVEPERRSVFMLGPGETVQIRLPEGSPAVCVVVHQVKVADGFHGQSSLFEDGESVVDQGIQTLSIMVLNNIINEIIKAFKKTQTNNCILGFV